MAKRLIEQENNPEINSYGPQFEERQAIFIDVDSTLCGIEGIDELGRICGVGDTVAQMTKDAMEGTIPFEEVFKARLELIKPTIADLNQVARRYRQTIVPDAKQTIDLLHKFGKKVFLLSGGFTRAIQPLAYDLDIPTDRILANTLYFNDAGAYAGYDEQNPLCQTGGKGRVIQTLEGKGAFYGKTLLVGDGASEIEAMPEVDLCVGFGGFVTRERVRREADVFFEEKTFAPLLPLMLGYDKCIMYDEDLLDEQEMLFVEDAIDRLDTLRIHPRAEYIRYGIGGLLDLRYEAALINQGE